MTGALAYYVHHLNPIIFDLGPIKPRWYGFAYLMGFLAAYILIKKLSRDGMLRLEPQKVPDLVLNCCIFGVLVGGRLGYCLFYDPHLLGFTSEFPYWGVLRVWDGGMSAHGGIVFTIIALVFFSWKNKVSPINVGDAACMVVPIGLFFGRIANFINGELYGHPSTVPWAVKFPSELYAPTNGVPTLPDAQVLEMKRGVAEYVAQHWQDLTTTEVQDFLRNHDEFTQVFGSTNTNSPTQLTAIKQQIADYIHSDPRNLLSSDIGAWWQHGHNALTQVLYEWFDKILPPRHPSQLYEALLEGVLLFIICWTIGRLWRKDGMASGAFLTFYPIMRIIGEQFRVGDSALAWTHTNLGAGVIYSLLMLIPAAIYWAYWIRRDRRVPWVPIPKAQPKNSA